MLRRSLMLTTLLSFSRRVNTPIGSTPQHLGVIRNNAGDCCRNPENGVLGVNPDAGQQRVRKYTTWGRTTYDPKFQDI